MVRFDLAVPADVRFGAGRASEVPAALATLGASRVLVVTGRTTSRADVMRSALTEAGIGSIAYGIESEPSIELVRDAVAVAAEAGCNAVLGFGGGSALDVAKAVAVLATSGTDPIDHLEVIGAGRPIERSGLPCVAVPTTAGTGSEVTRNSVLSGDGVKASLRSPLMLPKVAVVDPDLLAGVPQQTIAASGMDALSQLIEPLLSRRATHSPMRSPAMGSGDPLDRCAARTRRACRIHPYAKISRWPASSAGSAWRTPGSASSTALLLPLGRGSPRRMVPCVRPYLPLRWRSTCVLCATEPLTILLCHRWARWRLF